MEPMFTFLLKKGNLCHFLLCNFKTRLHLCLAVVFFGGFFLLSKLDVQNNSYDLYM